jgi:hypothetical protein
MLNYDDDALPHAKTDAKDWRESYYCNFFDHHNSQICGVFWQGQRPNAGVGETVLLLSDGKTDLIRSVNLKEIVPEDLPEGRRKAGNQEFTCVEPWKQWRVRYEKGPDWFELDWYQLSDVCDWEWEWGELAGEPAKHFEAAGRVHARGVVGGRKIELSGYGERDRAWGSRNYAPLEVSLWNTTQFPDDVAVHTFLVLMPSGEYRLQGFLHKDGETRDLARVDVTNLVYQSPKGPPVGGQMRYEDDAGRVVEISSFEFLNNLSFGTKKASGGQLGKDLGDADTLMFLSLMNFTRSDGVHGRGMIDYNCWTGSQPASIHAKAPIYSKLYKFGRE